jgi:Zn finger protein HypA/HybF involved in hydrogenase expression
MSRDLERQMVFNQQEFQCQECSFAITIGHHRSTCPHCGGEIDGPLSGSDD